MLILTDRDRIFQYIEYCGGFISLFLNLFVSYLCISCKSKELSEYRFFLLNIAVIDTLFIVLVAYGVQAVPLMPLIAGIVTGPISLFGPEYGGFIGFMTSQWLLVFSLMAINMCFQYRYVVIADTKWYDIFMARINLIGNYFLGVAIASGVVVYTSFSYVPPQEMIQIIADLFPELRDQLADTVVYGFHTTTSYLLLVVIGLPATCGLNLACAMLIFARLSELQKMMSLKTYAMHRRLTYALLVQMISPILTLGIPVMILFVSSSTVKNPNRLSGHLFVAFLTMHPIFNAMATLYFVKQFRDIIRKWLRKIFNCKEKQRGSVFKTKTNTIVMNITPR